MKGKYDVQSSSLMPKPLPTLSSLRHSRSLSGYVLGVDVGGTKTLIMASTLQGVVIAKRKWSTPRIGGVLEATWLVRTIEEFLEGARLPSGDLRALGVGVPGAVDVEAGRVFLAPNLGWVDGYPLRQRLGEVFRVPVLVDNDVNMAAIGEKVYGLGKEVENLVFVAVGTGIGAGVIINGQVYRGAHWSAGEIGFMALDSTCLNHAYGSHGYLELMASGQGIAERARGILRMPKKPGDLVKEMVGKEREDVPRPARDLDARRVFTAASRGDPLAAEIVSEALGALSLALTNIIALLDPELVVLGGGVLANRRILESIEGTVRRLVPTKSRIMISSLGTEAQAYGALVTAGGLVMENKGSFRK